MIFTNQLNRKISSAGSARSKILFRDLVLLPTTSNLIYFRYFCIGIGNWKKPQHEEGDPIHSWQCQKTKNTIRLSSVISKKTFPISPSPSSLTLFSHSFFSLPLLFTIDRILYKKLSAKRERIGTTRDQGCDKGETTFMFQCLGC